MPRPRDPNDLNAAIMQMLTSVINQLHEIRAANKHNAEEIVKMTRFIKDGTGGILQSKTDSTCPFPVMQASMTFQMK